MASNNGRPEQPATFTATSHALCAFAEATAAQLDGAELARRLNASASDLSRDHPYAALLLQRMANAADQAATPDSAG